jgi:proline dehydrogenase
MRVQLLTTPDCPHSDAARAAVQRVLREQGVVATLDEVVVTSLDDAESLAFHGSPTVRVNGVDVDPLPLGTPAGVACRLYGGTDGDSEPTVPADLLSAGIDRARREEEEGRGGVPYMGRLRPAAIMRSGFLWASRRRVLQRIATGTPLTRGLVGRFVAGDQLEEALVAIERLQDAGMHTTVDVLGESVTTEEEATASADRYLETLRALQQHGLDRNVSVKLTQMGLDLDTDFCLANVRRIVDCAADVTAFVRIDMEDHTRADATLAIARALHEEYPQVGVVIQSYLRRSAADIAALNAERIRVRLCKGAYDEPASVAFPTKPEVDDSYRELMERLLLEGNYPALATHDERLIDHAIDFSIREGVGRERFEFQMLYGVRRDLQRRLVRDGWTVRVYVPYGDEWYPYFMRRLAERPANVMFMLRSVLSEGRGRGSDSDSARSGDHDRAADAA